MNAPRSITDYLEQLRTALRGADPALIQDALYDAEEHLRSELAEQPERSEAAMLEHVVSSYGAPDEVAEIYRDQEIKIQRAIRPPAQPPRRSLAGRFFGVAADPRTYASLFYMLLSLATGIFYFTWVVTGLSLSVGLSVLIIGLPFIVLFFGSVRVLSLVEGRLVEAMLGMRMPRRPVYPTTGMTLMQRIGRMFTDVHTWTTLCYMWLMLPLGIVYFTLAVTLLSMSVTFIAAPLLLLFHSDWLPGFYVDHQVTVDWGFGAHAPNWADAIGMCAFGIVLLFTTLHVARGVGRMHGLIAKHMLVPRTDG
ncbi:sensor domain-containing protein [Rhodanobacter sp. AS-Z3]|uniref:sensor domain-containing protein n=1 Tax=Rhodanobacter sp. AS-Z3 TaxID=3031330 RepID=UPI00247978EE|nr:sensor domain-containing protein [Rhodanobacter sp. AS-Z3]WEN16744.1 sensor domain-containing protein [Rhodanobacter sp. AS-Z3]